MKFRSDLSIPSPSSSQVLVRVVAASINPVDYKINRGKIPFARHVLPLGVAVDFSGVRACVWMRVRVCVRVNV